MATVSAQELYQALVGAGISAAAALGIMANAANESGGGNPLGPFDLGATGDNGCSHGLLQWNTCGGGYQSMAGADLQTQVAYIKQTVPQSCLDGSSATSIAGCIAANFERCVGCSPGGSQYNSRVANAQQLLGQNFASGSSQAQQAMGATTPTASTSGALTSQSGCAYQVLKGGFLGQDGICADGVIGMLAAALGAVIILVALAVLTGFGQQAAGTAIGAGRLAVLKGL